MNFKLLTLLSAAAVAVAAGSAAAAAGKTPSVRGAAYRMAMTAYGAPDLQGTWTNATLTPFERPTDLGDKGVLSAADARKIEAEDAAHRKASLKPTDPSVKTQDLPYDCGRGFKGVNCGYNDFWVDPGNKVVVIDGQARTSILTSPANGRMPPLTPAGKAAFQQVVARRGGGHAFDGPESRALGERCITSFGSSAGPPMLPVLYNNTYQIVQTPTEVAIEIEMVHDVRHIRISTPERPLQHAPPGVKTWLGDSIGHWEGKTLVVETTNNRHEMFQRGGSDEAKVIERFTRISPTEIDYKFEVVDPTIYTAPYAGELIFNATKGPIYEYACQEGNYALPHILAGAREKEKQGLPPG